MNKTAKQRISFAVFINDYTGGENQSTVTKNTRQILRFNGFGLMPAIPREGVALVE
jgi:hypothetical protein